MNCWYAYSNVDILVLDPVQNGLLLAEAGGSAQMQLYLKCDPWTWAQRLVLQRF
jgi:hypothetical protein